MCHDELAILVSLSARGDTVGTWPSTRLASELRSSLPRVSCQVTTDGRLPSVPSSLVSLLVWHALRPVTPRSLWGAVAVATRLGIVYGARARARASVSFFLVPRIRNREIREGHEVSSERTARVDLARSMVRDRASRPSIRDVVVSYSASLRAATRSNGQK